MEYKDITDEMLEDELMKFGALIIGKTSAKYVLPERNRKLAKGMELTKSNGIINKRAFLARCCQMFYEGVSELFDIVINQTKKL